MINLSKQSTRRASRTKTKVFILASLIVGLMAVPFSACAQISTDQCTYNITDNSPSSWTLEVQFNLSNLDYQFNHFPDAFAFSFCDQNATVSMFPTGFLPFNICVASNGLFSSTGVYVAFYGPDYGAYSLENVAGLNPGTFPVVHVPGTATTIAGFFGTSVTLHRQNPTDYSPVTVTVKFSSAQLIINNINLITSTINSLGLNNGAVTSLSAPLGQAVSLINDGNPNNDAAVCGQLDAFITQVNNNGSLSLSEATQLLGAANAMKNSLGCQ